MNTLHRFTLFSFLIPFTLVGAGCISCSKNSSDEPEINKPDDNGTTEITSLYQVILPSGTPEQIKEYTGFTVSFNKDNRTPNYVAWELLDTETTGAADRNDYDFWQDTELEGCPTKDYQFSTYGYERGHMCPAAEQKWSGKAMNDCFSMANMCPQDHDINSGAWETLESKERQWAKRDGAVWIIAGPIYEDSDTQRIGASGVRVPSAFFKVLLAKDIKEPRAIAFVFPNMDAPGTLQNYAMSVDNLEKQLGYDFFSFLPDDVENKVEASFSFTEWNKSY